MIMDRLVEFCDAVALSTSGTGLAAIGTNLNMSDVRDYGNGQPLYLVITVDTAVESGGACSVAFQLVSDAQDPPTADGNETLHWESHAIPKATLVAGYTLCVPLPWENPPYEQYLGIQQNVSSNAVTAGKINAFLTIDGHGWKAYADAIT